MVALRYGHRKDFKRFESFLMEPRSLQPRLFNYFFWIVCSAEQIIFVDTGFSVETARRPN